MHPHCKPSPRYTTAPNNRNRGIATWVTPMRPEPAVPRRTRIRGTVENFCERPINNVPFCCGYTGTLLTERTMPLTRCLLAPVNQVTGSGSIFAWKTATQCRRPTHGPTKSSLRFQLASYHRRSSTCQHRRCDEGETRRPRLAKRHVKCKRGYGLSALAHWLPFRSNATP